MPWIPRLVAAAALVAGHGAAAAEPEWRGAEIAWFDSFGTEHTDWANRIIERPDGSLVATGFVNRADGGDAPPSWDAVLRKYDAAGELVWTRRSGGPAIDAGWAVVELADGRLAVSGMSSSHGAGGLDAILQIASAAGETLSEQRLGGAGDDRATELLKTNDGGLLLVGQTSSIGAGDADVLAIRTDGNGRELWRRAYGTPRTDRGFFAAAAPEGGFVIAGVTGAADAYDYLLMKIDGDGRELWRRVIAGDANDPNHGVVLAPDGRIVFVGYTRSWGSRDHDVSVIHFTAGGEPVRHQIIGGPGDDRAQFAALARDGSVWITGYTKSFGGGDWDIMLVKVDASGTVEPWMGAVGSAADDNGSAILAAGNGDLLITGYSSAPSNGAAPPDAFVMRVKPGTILRRTEGVSVREGPLS